MPAILLLVFIVWPGGQPSGLARISLSNLWPKAEFLILPLATEAPTRT